MHPKSISTRGVAAEVVILAVFLIGGAGWFGVKELKHSITEYQQKEKVEKAEREANAAKAQAEKAQLERDKAESSRVAAEKARAEQRTAEIDQGRNIQRASTQANAAIQQLPLSKQRDFLSARISDIDIASAGIFGPPLANHVENWKQTAIDALEGKAAALAEVEKQRTEIATLNAKLVVLREATETAERKFNAENARANEEQKKATTAAAKTVEWINKAKEAFETGGAAESLATGLKLILVAVAGIWLLGLCLKIFSVGLPEDGPWSKAINTAANTFHSMLAPMAVLGETQAHRDTERYIENSGTFLSDLRRGMPDTAAKVTPLLDVAYSPRQQRKVRQAYLNVEKRLAAEAAEAKTQVAANNPGIGT